MDSKELRTRRKNLRDENKKWPKTLAPVPPELWPTVVTTGVRIGLWRSRDFLVQVFVERGGVKRLSVCRTELDCEGQWKDGIAWEELQRLKAECGFGDCDAAEVYPRESDVVNVANMRHLWVFSEPIEYGWRVRNSPNDSSSATRPAGGEK